MANTKRSSTNNSNKDVIRYAGLGTQFLVAIGLAVFAGLRLDRWLHTSPLFSVALPLLILTGMYYKLVRETGKPKDDESK